MKRNIILIDEDKCTGCGLCVPNCAEGSLEIRDGKAVLVREALCDGLGACLGHCPEGALIIEEREAEGFDEDLVNRHLAAIGREPLPHGHSTPAPAAPRTGGCPSAQSVILPGGRADSTPAASSAEQSSELTHWPVQLTLLPPHAPFFKDADLLISADCVPFAHPDFHRTFLHGRPVAVACPKLDNADAHFQKLVQIFQQGKPASVTILRMEVPCCGGLTGMVTQAHKQSGSTVPVREVVVGRNGGIVEDRVLA